MNCRVRFRAGTLTAILLALNVAAASGHRWSDWHWHWNKHALAIIVESPNYNPEIAAARTDWSTHTHLELIPATAHGSADVSVVAADYGDTGWAGLASVEAVGRNPGDNCATEQNSCHVTHAHARYNIEAGGKRGVGKDSDVRGYFCQELGHTWGLDHSDNGDCMGKNYFEKNNSNLSGPHDWADTDAAQ